MVNSKKKGARGEREVRDLLKSFGIEARRGQQYSGSPESPDVVSDMEGYHHEVKFTERFKLYDAIDQADDDRAEHEVPLIWHRKKGREWVVCIKAEDFMKMYCELKELKK